jgi:hypothetical protein
MERFEWELPWDDERAAAGDCDDEHNDAAADTDLGRQPGDLPIQSSWDDGAGVEHTARGRGPAWVTCSGFAV